MKGNEPNARLVEHYKNQMIKALEQFEEYFLSDGSYINGNQISYSDIAAACEIEQTRKYGSMVFHFIIL